MDRRHLSIIGLVCAVGLTLVSAPAVAADKQNQESSLPAKVYVPYEKLKSVFEKEQQGVFLPYEEFQRLWQAAQGKPADVSAAPFKYLISTARFAGTVKDELATIQLELTVDILAKGWVEVPIALDKVGVSKASFIEPRQPAVKPLLRFADGQYLLTVNGKGRYVLALEFVRQLQTQPGLHVLSCRVPSAAVTTLELLIPEENLKVDVEPMLAATTSQEATDGAKATRLQAFLGSTKEVRLSWKPETEAAPGLEAVVVCEQFQHISVAEALITCEAKLDYTIRRGGVDSFTVQLPGQFRVTDISGANISRWEVEDKEVAGGAPGVQSAKVRLYSPAKDTYSLTIKMERFVQEKQTQIPLVPITTEGVLRQTGLIGVTCSPRRLVQLKDVRNLARVDTGRLPQAVQSQPGALAYRFIASDYSGTIAIETASPRITVNQRWRLGVENERLVLQGQIAYKVERTGIFELKMSLPEPWKVESVGPENLVDDYQLKGTGAARELYVLLRTEKTGGFDIVVLAHTDRADPESKINFELPLADARDLQQYQGELTLLLADHLRAEIEELQQLQAAPLKETKSTPAMAGLSPAMAFEFRAIDRAKGAGAKFKIAVKPPQISAVVYRLVDIRPGSTEQEAVINYTVRYAPVDTFYLKMPEELAQAAEISGRDIKEKPRIQELPAEQRTDADRSAGAGEEWAYYKVVLQSKVIGSYELKVRVRQVFQAGEVGQATTVKVGAILAGGKISDQNGYITVAKAETLAIGEPEIENLVAADPTSAADLPYEPHRRIASLAFKYNAPPFALSMPVVTQKEATVFTTIASGAVIEQVLARDGMLNTHATFLLQTSRGDRLPITLPADAELTAVLLNGEEAPVEIGVSENERVVRLPPSAGQISRFVLEISYGLKGASTAELVVPQLPGEVPVQQTLWRLWVPKEYCLLGHSRAFSRLEAGQHQRLLEMLRARQPSQVTFKLPSQGKALDFVRQGAPGKLSVRVAGKEGLSILIWAVVIVAGALMLKLSGLHRVLVILAAGLAAGVVHLYLPLLVVQAVRIGVFAAVLVVLVWAAQWGFVRVPQIRLALPARQKKQPAAGRKPGADKKKREQSKEEQE
jgi:hypothetical protein